MDEPTEEQRQAYLKDVEKFGILFTDDVHVSQLAKKLAKLTAMAEMGAPSPIIAALAKMDWDMDDMLCTVAVYVSHVTKEHGHEIHGEE